MANLVGYARVSSDSQKDNTSLPAQKKAIEEYCQKKGHDLVAFYQDIESAATIEKREAIQWALKTVDSLADGLIVYRLDRLSRRVLDAEKIKNEFAEKNKVLISVSDPVTLGNETGDLMYTISLAVAEFERKRINKRCRDGIHAKKESGGYYSGRPPYGYASYRGTLIEVPSEQEVIQLIEHMYFEEGETFSGIARYLNDLGIRTKTGKKWYLTAVRAIVNEEGILLKRLEGKTLPASAWLTSSPFREDRYEQQRGQEQ